MPKDASSRAIERSRRRLRRAISVAGLSAGTMAFFGALSLLTGWNSPPALLIGTLLVLCALQEYRGRRMLRALEAEGPAALSRNQAFIGAGIAGYCLLCALAPAQLDPDLRAALSQAGMGAEADRLFDFAARITKAVYFFVIAATLFVQIFVGWFYASRAKDVATLRAVGAGA